MHKAYVDTRNFSFEAYGETEEAAKATLRRTLDEHARQYHIVGGAFIADVLPDATVIEITLGCGYRDLTRIFPPYK